MDILNTFGKIFTMEPNRDYLASEEIRHAGLKNEERTLAILVHVLSIFFWFIPALVIYLLKKDESPFVAANAKEALNFQLSLIIMYIVSFILIILLIGFLMLTIVYILSVVCCIIAAVKAADNVVYKYPLTIRFIK